MSDELVYRYEGGPVIEIWRRALEDGRWMHRIDVQNGIAGVVIIATDGERVLLQRQWREAVGLDVWQLPRGFAETGDAEQDARRELSEETSLRGDDGRVLGRVLPDPGLLSTAIDVVEFRFAALETEQMAPQDPREQINDFRAVTLDELDEWIRSGALVDGISLAALAVWRAAA